MKVHARTPLSEPAACFIFHNDHLLVQKHRDKCSLPRYTDLPKADGHQLTLLPDHKTPIYIVNMNHRLDNTQSTWYPIKSFFVEQSNTIQQQLSLAYQWMHFEKSHQFCGICAHQLTWHEVETAKICQSCEHLYYPRLSPVVMVLIHSGTNILLARSPHFKNGFYSVLAGFVEPGETLEQTIKREVWEEVGLEIKDITYSSSQSWPFPHSLMMGFHAQYANGDIQVDGIEIESADWFDYTNLPALPSKASLAHQLIFELKEKMLT